MRLDSWYARPIAAACALAALGLLGAAALSGASVGPNENAANFAWAVTIQHFGVDAYEMQRTVTEPLENALSAVPGRTEMRSFSEYGKSRVILYMRDSDDETYTMIRDAVERVHATLPRSAQRPVINSTSEGRQPVWLAAVRAEGMPKEEFARRLDREIKSAFEKLEGSGEVETYGTGVPEIRVEVDPARAASLGLDPAACASAVAASDFLGTCGVLRTGDRGLAIVAYGRIEALADMKDIRIQIPEKGSVPLGAVADVSLEEREYESVSRVDGRAEAIIALRPGGKANLIGLSRAIEAETERWRERGFTFSVIVDTGKELSSSFKGILLAMLQGMAAVAIIIPFIAKGVRTAIVASGAVPLITALSAAAMAALGYTFDQHVLSGIAIGLGTSVDAVVVAVERLKDLPTPLDSSRRMARLIPSLAGGALTSVIVLAPLMGMGYADEGIKATAMAVGTIVIVAFLAGSFLVPVFLSRTEAPGASALPLPDTPARARPQAWKALRKKARRAFAQVLLWSVRRRGLAIGLSLAVSAGSAALLLSSPMDFSAGMQTSVVSVHIECEPEASMESVDRRLLAYSEDLKGVKGVITVQTTAKRGSGDAEISFDPALTDGPTVSEAARALGMRIPNAFAFLTEGIGTSERSYEITVSGDDDAALRSLAQDAAGALRALPYVSETVLNFKEGPQTASLLIDHAAAARYGTDAATIADSLRRYVQGPVGHKKILDDRELDVRFMSGSGRVGSVEDVLKLPIAMVQGSAIPAAAVLKLTWLREPSRLYRKNRNNVAFFTVRTSGVDVRTAHEGVSAVLDGMDRPPGYAFEFDRAAIELAERYAESRYAFIAALAFIYIVLAALSESFSAPLAVLSILPVAMLPPIAALRLGWGGIRLSGMASLVVLSGIIVNLSILIVDEARERTRPGKGASSWLYGAVRARALPIAFMSLSTVAGALPMAFVPGSGAEFMKALAVASAWGSIGALLASFSSLPAFLALYPRVCATRRQDADFDAIQKA